MKKTVLTTLTFGLLAGLMALPSMANAQWDRDRNHRDHDRDRDRDRYERRSSHLDIYVNGGYWGFGYSNYGRRDMGYRYDRDRRRDWDRDRRDRDRDRDRRRRDRY